MSLRRRLAVVLALGLSALVIAFVAIGHLLATTDDARERAAKDAAETGAQALVERLDTVSFRGDLDAAPTKQLQAAAASLLRAVPAAAGGYCTQEGAILVTAGRLEARHGLGPEVHDAVAALCTHARSNAPAVGRFEGPRGVDRIAVVAAGDRGGAWFLARARARGGDEAPAWPWEVVLLAVAAVALAVCTVDAMMALRRGADELQGALVTLQDDLRAPVPRPRAQELGDIAAGLSAMAAHLADARDRERALEATLARTQRLSALGRVVAGVAHEVRNPLAGMKLRLDLLARSGGLDAAASEDVQVCLGEIARLNRVVESLLMVSRAKTLAEMPIDLAALADERIARTAPIAARTGVRLARRGEAHTFGDPHALAGAVDNLLRNAVEASPTGSEVTVHLGVVHDGAASGPILQGAFEGAAQGTPVLDVEDSGPGVPEARRTELFEPFFTTKPEGTGLGLWISRLLLEAKGASLRYDRIGDRTRMRIAFARPVSAAPPASARIPPTLP
jgi:signal transduction histidine kinase